MTRPTQIRLDNAAPGERQYVTRRDTYRLDKAVRQSDGSLRVDALVTRTGVFVYHDADGTEVREYRPADEVLNQDSINSLKDKTVTVLHPPGLVDASNWRQYSVGHVSGEPMASEGGVKAKLVISAQDAVSAIEAGELKEISCGYQLYTEDAPGTTSDGQRYDRIQRGIQYNHVAVGPQGWGRQGSGVSLRLDSKGNQVTETGERTMQKIKIHFDGQTYEVEAGSAEHTNLLKRIAEHDAAVKAKLDAATVATTEATAAKARADAAEAAKKEIQARLDAAPALARARVKLEAQVSSVLGADFKHDSDDGKAKTDREIQIAALAKLDPEFKADGKDDVYVCAYFDSVLSRTPKSNAQEGLLLGHRGDAAPVFGNRVDSAWFREDGGIRIDEDDVNYYDACVAKNRRDAASAFKRPLAVSKDRTERV